MTDETPAPTGMKANILRRIAAEPARVETDAAGGIVAVNPAFTAMCGYSFAEIRGRKPGSFLQGADTDPTAVDRLRQAIRHGTFCEEDLVNYHKDGSAYRVRISIEAIRDSDGTVSGYRAVERELPEA
jgi:PAS domain S-box-containing protein